MSDSIISNTVRTTLSTPPSPSYSKRQRNTTINHNSNDNGNKRRLKVLSACNECRRKKIKCDGKEPCVCCIKSNKRVICKYTTTASSEKLGGRAILPTKRQSHNSDRHHPYPHKQQKNDIPPLSLTSINTTTTSSTTTTTTSSMTSIQSIESRLAAIEDVLHSFVRRHQQLKLGDQYENEDSVPQQQQELVQKIREEVSELRRIQLPPLRHDSSFPSSPVSPTSNKQQSAFIRPSISNHYPYYSPFSTCSNSPTSSNSGSSPLRATRIGSFAGSGSSFTPGSAPLNTSASAAGSANVVSHNHYYSHHSYSNNSVY
ncbi:hypothetical protein BDF20DRAFT_916694 [Mycotypha africana]|uniref:uncharacterized protein n=1 Tax=Mycotypha africana TaxID=64632 RepID=UPI0023004C02|nr:uncharacterized protein BDF20DRAFT_916694 [Mycotypha africana]KAI8969337.1 hypothetical protein BDF20DRAFT_916694 [Mycotypha africana]